MSQNGTTSLLTNQPSLRSAANKAHDRWQQRHVLHVMVEPHIGKKHAMIWGSSLLQQKFQVNAWKHTNDHRHFLAMEHTLCKGSCRLHPHRSHNACCNGTESNTGSLTIRQNTWQQS